MPLESNKEKEKEHVHEHEHEPEKQKLEIKKINDDFKEILWLTGC